MRYLGIVATIAVCLAVSATAGATGVMWGTGSPDWSYTLSGPSPVIFQFDTSTGVISTTFSFETSNWMWTSGVADNGKYLYASHNIYDIKTDPRSTNTHDLRIAKIDRDTGAVLSDTSISGFLGQTYSQVNALDFHCGRLYAVENATSGSNIRGYALEIQLDANGDVVGAVRGAYVGPYPDCGLDYHDGLWYATSWTASPGGYLGETSNIMTSPDIMNTAFTTLGTASGIGMIDGLEYDSSGNIYAVSWYGPSATSVYGLNPGTWAATSLYDLQGQLPSKIIQLNGLSEVVPEPLTMAGLMLGIGSVLTYVRKRRMA